MEKDYWDSFYEKYGYEDNIQKHSSFAEFCQLEVFGNKQFNVVELGSGNGRDSIFFVKNNHNVVAIDQSIKAINIEYNKVPLKYKDNIMLKNSDFILEDYSTYFNIDVFYSRFTLHSIAEKDETIVLKKVYEALKSGGLFCIEARTIKDSLYGKGNQVEKHAFFTDHYRRFIDSDIFIKKALSIGFKINYFLERNNLSIYKNDNPFLMRILLEK